jgi:hypothetical protein
VHARHVCILKNILARIFLLYFYCLKESENVWGIGGGMTLNFRLLCALNTLIKSSVCAILTMIEINRDRASLP